MNWLILIPVVLALTVLVARRGGCGEIGRRIRNSDHWALEDAIHEKEELIEGLVCEASQTKNGWRRQEVLDDAADVRAELAQLIALRPKYPLTPKE